jgi:serine/threonine protein phosphatase 1
MPRKKAPVEISEWKPAPFDVAGETVFAIGDTHGCTPELTALLETIRNTQSDGSRRRLVFIGDLIDRGPDSLGTLALWTEAERLARVDRVDSLMGNHEQLMLLAISGGPHAKRVAPMWLEEGGNTVLAEMRAKVGNPKAPLSADLVAATLGEKTTDLLSTLRSHVRVGNTLFVHGGIDPKADQDEYLARPWMGLKSASWAWAREGFIDWAGGFGGTMVVHGHTPPHKHRPISGMQDPVQFHQDRLCIDAGSDRSGFVAAAQIEKDRHRIFRAGKLLPNALI